MLYRQSIHRPATLDDLIGPGLAAKLDRLDVLSRKIFAGKLPGERRSKRRGRSVEFDDFRNYTPGDDLRHIDWNVYARLDRLFIKLFREEEDLCVSLAIDVSASMDSGDPSKLVFVHRVAMALAYIGLVNQNRVQVGLFGREGDDAQQLAPLRGRSGIARVSSMLLASLQEADAAPANPRESSLEGLRRLARARSGRGVMIVLSDLLVPTGLESTLNALAAAGGGVGGGAGAAYDTFVLQVLSPSELDPAKDVASGLVGDLRLTDAETGRGAEVTISQAMIRQYRRRMEELRGRVRRQCHARGLGYFLVPSDTPVETLVLDSLRRGGLLR